MSTPRFTSLRAATLASGAAIAAMALPATAQAGDVYVGASGGAVFAEDSANSGQFDATVPATEDWGEIPAGTSLGWDTDFDTGYVLSGVVGYAFDNGLRTELEVTYSENDVDTHSGLTAGGANIDAVDVAVLTRGAPDAANPTVGAVIADGRGSVSNLGVFANVYYDIATGSSITPYVGAGLGYVSTDVDYSPSGVPVANDDDGGLAWQAMAGVSFTLSERAEVFGQYTYRSRFDDADVALDLLPATLGIESDQSLLTAGVRLRFGS